MGFLERGLVPTMIQIIKSIHLIKQLRIHLNFIPHVAIKLDDRDPPCINSNVSHLINEEKMLGAKIISKITQVASPL